MRRSGPGGQHRNKVETAICITHLPSGIKSEANERRSQELNRKEALKRLRVKLACNLRKYRKHPMIPSPLWNKHCHNKRLSISLSNSDYPSLLAEALDVIYQEALDLRKSSVLLNCSSSQLIKFLKQTPSCWSQLNQDRKEKGLYPFK